MDRGTSPDIDSATEDDTDSPTEDDMETEADQKRRLKFGSQSEPAAKRQKRN